MVSKAKMAIGLVGAFVAGYAIYKAYEMTHAKNIPVTPPRVVYKNEAARKAAKIESASPGVVLTKQTVKPDGTVVIEAKKPTTARETAAVMTHIVTPGSRTAPRPGPGGQARAI